MKGNKNLTAITHKNIEDLLDKNNINIIATIVPKKFRLAKQMTKIWSKANNGKKNVYDLTMASQALGTAHKRKLNKSKII